MRIEIETDNRCAEEIARTLSERLDALADLYERKLKEAKNAGSEETAIFCEREAEGIEALMKSLEKAKDSVFDQIFQGGEL